MNQYNKMSIYMNIIIVVVIIVYPCVNVTPINFNGLFINVE